MKSLINLVVEVVILCLTLGVDVADKIGRLGPPDPTIEIQASPLVVAHGLAGAVPVL